MIPQQYLDENGLINCDNLEKCGFNSILFSVEYALASQDAEYTAFLKNFINNKLRLVPGMYTSLPGCKEYISHDNLTAIMCMLGSVERREVFSELLRNFFRYDDQNLSNPSWTRIMHPRDIIYYGQLAGSKVCWLLLPLLFVMFCFACVEDGGPETNTPYETSGALLLYVRCKGMNNWIYRLMFRFFTWQISFNALSTWKQIALYYFKNDPNHPVVRSITE